MDHLYEENDIEAFKSDSEGHYFDRKSARKDTDEIAKHVMAFANAAGGKLVVGIEDDGTVTGFKREKAHSIESFERAHVTEGMDIDILCAKPYTGMAGLIQLASLQRFT